MKVRLFWEFEADIEGLDMAFIDIPALAKDLAKNEIRCLLCSGELTVDDFECEIVEE